MPRVEQLEAQLARLEAGILGTHTPSVDVAYFDFSPRNRRFGSVDSAELALSLIVDLSRKGKRLVGIEVLGATKHLEGIVDLSTFRNYRQDTRKGRVSPEQLAQVVNRMVATDEQAVQNPTTRFVLESLEDLDDLKEGVKGMISAEKEGTIPWEQVKKDLNLE